MIDKNQIREHMEVVDENGTHVGTVDHVDGEDKIKLTRKDPAAGGEHHWISISAIASIDDKVKLNCPAGEAYVS